MTSERTAAAGNQFLASRASLASRSLASLASRVPRPRRILPSVKIWPCFARPGVPRSSYTVPKAPLTEGEPWLLDRLVVEVDASRLWKIALAALSIFSRSRSARAAVSATGSSMLGFRGRERFDSLCTILWAGVGGDLNDAGVRRSSSSGGMPPICLTFVGRAALRGPLPLSGEVGISRSLPFLPAVPAGNSAEPVLRMLGSPLSPDQRLLTLVGSLMVVATVLRLRMLPLLRRVLYVDTVLGAKEETEEAYAECV